MNFRRIWVLFSLVAVLLLGSDIAYLRWRWRSFVPLSEPIDLTRPGSYSFAARGLHGSPYHPQLHLDLPFLQELDGWFADAEYQQIWGGSPPELAIRVLDPEGRTLLEEKGPITRSNGWRVTGSTGPSEVEIYKLTEFGGHPFTDYRVSLEILRGSPTAAAYQPRIEIAAIKAYAFLPSFLAFYALVVLIGVVAFFIGVAQLVAYRRARSETRALPSSRAV